MGVYFQLAWFLLASFDTLIATEITTSATESSEEVVEYYKTLPPYNIIMIYNVSQEKSENQDDVDKKVSDIGHKLGIEMIYNNPLHDIQEAYRSKIPKNMFPKPIIVHMNSRRLAEKWEKAYEEKKQKHLLNVKWHLEVGQPNNTAIIKEAVDDWAKKMKYPHVWFDDTNTTVFYTKQKYHHSPPVYTVNDIIHMNELLRTGQHYHLFELTWKPEIYNESAV